MRTDAKQCDGYKQSSAIILEMKTETEDKNELYRAALDHWGADAQMDQAIEECSELIKAICKYKRDPDSANAMAAIKEEAADVFIMLEQLSLITGPFEEEKSEKLKKLKTLLDEEL